MESGQFVYNNSFLGIGMLNWQKFRDIKRRENTSYLKKTEIDESQ